MHCLEKYSLDCGIIAADPHISMAFFPVVSDRYIIIENSCRAKCAEYKHIDELMSYISPFLKKFDVDIIQLKVDRKDRSIPRCKTYENLSFPQMNYLINNSELVLSNDYFLPAIASAMNKDTISLHGVFPKNSNCPVWGKGKHINLEPKQAKLLREDSNANIINSIYPETIAATLLQMLNISSPLAQVKPIYCGDLFVNKSLEIVPDFDANETSIQNENINIRADYHFDETNIFKLIARNPSNLVTNKLPSPQCLANPLVKKNLIQVNYEVTLDTKQEEIDKLLELGTSVNIFCKDIENISQVRLNLIDYEVTLEKLISKKELDIDGEICDNTCYKSSKIIISNNKHYSSKAKWLKNEPLQTQEFERVIDSPDFWDESEHFKLFNINGQEKDS